MLIVLLDEPGRFAFRCSSPMNDPPDAVDEKVAELLGRYRATE